MKLSQYRRDRPPGGSEDRLPACHGKQASRLLLEIATRKMPVGHDKQDACLPNYNVQRESCFKTLAIVRSHESLGR
jgi:hypothetical protein